MKLFKSGFGIFIFIILLPFYIMFLPLIILYYIFGNKKEKIKVDDFDRNLDIDEGLIVDHLTKEERDAFYRGEKTIYELYDMSQKRKTR